MIILKRYPAIQQILSADLDILQVILPEKVLKTIVNFRENLKNLQKFEYFNIKLSYLY